MYVEEVLYRKEKLLHPMGKPTAFKSILFSLCLVFFCIANASVPRSSTFKYVNEGDFGGYMEFIVEYDARYRIIRDISTGPFILCFYKTTPNAYTLGLLMGTTGADHSMMRWVWEANRGNPVGENASLTFSTDGNLVLAGADGRVAWQTNTVNKGVVGFKLLENGNMVLHDSKGNYVWQSFDYPTDTLLVGQSLKLGVTPKLVSRASKTKNLNGPYSLVLDGKDLNLYYTSPKSSKPFLYHTMLSVTKGPLQNVTLVLDYELGLAYTGADDYGGTSIFHKPKYNSTYTYLRLEMDGNIKLYTYEENTYCCAWEVSFTLFDGNSWESECQLPERCGNFGLCEDNQCVGCPTPRGYTDWSQNCQQPKLTSCESKDFRYYKLVGVDHFMIKYNRSDGPMKQDDCSSKCTKDCKCLGYFYNTQSSRCWIAYDLKTMTRVGNSTHLAYIKAPIGTDNNNNYNTPMFMKTSVQAW